MFLKTTLSFVLAIFCGTAGAQVYRCPDKVTGKITYSDAPCTDGKEIVRQMSEDERMLNAERAMIARQRHQLDQERAAMRQQQADQAARSTASPQQTPQPIDPIACQRAQREVSIASNIKTEDKRTRMNAAIIQVNAACGMKTELLQEPTRIYVAPRRW